MTTMNLKESQLEPAGAMDCGPTKHQPANVILSILQLILIQSYIVVHIMHAVLSTNMPSIPPPIVSPSGTQCIILKVTI